MQSSHLHPSSSTDNTLDVNIYVFLARSDRYCHNMDEDDTEDDSEDIMFHSFSSCSSRYIKFEEMKEVHCCSLAIDDMLVEYLELLYISACKAIHI